MNNSLLKKIALTLCCIMILGSLTACGNTKTQESSSADVEPSSSVVEPSSKESEVVEEEPSLKDRDWSDVEFRIGWTGSDAQINAVLSVIESFESDYDNLFVNAEFAGWGEYLSRTATQAAGNQFPDVVMQSYAYFKGYNDEGLLLPLNEYIESGKLDLSGVSDANIQLGMLDGNIVTIALGNNAPCYIYDTAKLEEAGVTMSKNPTLEEFTEVCKAVYDKTGAKIYPANPNDAGFRPWGSYIYTDDGSDLAITADQLAGYYEWYYDGIDYGYIDDLHTMVDLGTGLYEGKYWAGWSWSNGFADIQAATKLNLDFIPMPAAVEGDCPTFLQPTLCWSVAASSENPDLAVEFINYYINNKNSWSAVGTLYGSPISADGRAYVSRSSSGADKQCLEFISWLADENLVGPIYKPSPAYASQLTPLWQGLRDKIGLLELKRDDIRTEIDSAIVNAKAIIAEQ